MSDVLSFALITSLVVIPLSIFAVVCFMAFLGAIEIQDVIVQGPLL